MIETFRLLARWPKLGGRRIEVRDQDVRCYVVGSYLVFYRVTTPIEIVAIVHGARDVGSVLDEREL